MHITDHIYILNKNPWNISVRVYRLQEDNIFNILLVINLTVCDPQDFTHVWKNARGMNLIQIFITFNIMHFVGEKTGT
jgi:hypothetical protein